MIAERLFGTDGVRGVANADLTADLALRLGMAAGLWVREAAAVVPEPALAPPARGVEPPVKAERDFVVVGRDTRLSGDMLEAAISAGLASMGVDVVNVGVVPTPAVAQIAVARGAAAGVVISASHNPFPDNGIKFFGRNGKKLPNGVEDRIQALMSEIDALSRPTGAGIGAISSKREPVDEYVSRVMASARGAGHHPLAGMRLMMDCANGAAYEVAPIIFRDLGAEVVVIHAEPDGVNINVDCGSTRPQDMAARVVAEGANAGFAFDGDADRVWFADENGNDVDGDRMMAIIARSLQARGMLPGDVVVATIMSNVGLEQALAVDGIHLHRTDVGDRCVAEAMERLGAAIGGEQSGHILLPNLTPSGDGLVTALQVLLVMRETGKPLSKLASVVQSCPQLLKNVRVKSKQGWRDDPDILAVIEQGRVRLGSDEWLSVRPSGTEPLIRVMAQGTERETVEAVVHDICAVFESKLGRVG